MLNQLLQRIFNAAEMPKYAEKICNMHTLLKYAKIRQSAKYVISAYSHFSDMPNQCVHVTLLKI